MAKNRYDFAVFGFFSDEIGQVFFPPQKGNADIVESFSVFGLAFLMRPSKFFCNNNFTSMFWLLYNLLLDIFTYKKQLFYLSIQQMKTKN